MNLVAKGEHDGLQRKTEGNGFTVKRGKSGGGDGRNGTKGEKECGKDVENGDEEMGLGVWSGDSGNGVEVVKHGGKRDGEEKESREGQEMARVGGDHAPGFREYLPEAWAVG
ncbi:GTP cyclohydrolase II [Striga asiatica]|uniref:GTP cyclohydrolase II n=1 Tax=Striga asiatica TaxID=4170 RepID=A0A5A7QER5_STRAF|nr:GTP cyclohydrolase II [Striga asiatica]